jgi:hypothetical protein
VGACALTVMSVADLLSHLTPNTGSLAWPIAIPILLVAYGMAAGVVTVLASSLSAFILNEFGFFNPWPRGRVRVWAIVAMLAVGPAVLLLGYKLLPTVFAPIIDRLIVLWG